MKIEIPRLKLIELIKGQLKTLFLFDEQSEGKALLDAVDLSLEHCEFCFRHNRNKYYQQEGETYFNPYHSGQYSIFLYFLSRQLYLFSKQRNTLADRVYYLNKCLNCLDIYYEVEMPSIFFLDHPLGSVLGRAKYGEKFSFSQNCTVGNNKGGYPAFGENVKMMSSSKVLGNCKIESNVIISANTYIKDCDIPEYSLVFGSSPNLVIKKKEKGYFTEA
jgi:serine O-acetyltransferase